MASSTTSIAQDASAKASTPPITDAANTQASSNQAKNPKSPFGQKVHRSLLTPVRKRPSRDVSIVGLIYVTIMMLMGVAAINTQANLLFGVFGLMIGILLISGVISRIVLRRIRVRRDLPEMPTVGLPALIVYRLKNGKRFWPSLSVTLAELDGTEAFTKQASCYMLHAAAGVEATVPVEMIPKRRGLHRLGQYQVSTSFPFGFIKRAVNRQESGTLLVLPALGNVDSRLMRMCMAVESPGPTLRPRRGGQDEFYGVREYRTGDNPRLIYWKRSARNPGQLILKEMAKAAPPKILILLDTYIRDNTPTEADNIERAISMAASLANHALTEGLQVGIVAYTGDVLPTDERAPGYTIIPCGKGKRHTRDILTTLARLPRNAQSEPAELIKAADLIARGGMTRITFTPYDPASSADIPPPGGTSRESGRNASLVLCSASQAARSYFSFPDAVDFSKSMPLDQQPMIKQ